MTGNGLGRKSHESDAATESDRDYAAGVMGRANLMGFGSYSQAEWCNMAARLAGIVLKLTETKVVTATPGVLHLAVAYEMATRSANAIIEGDLSMVMTGEAPAGKLVGYKVGATEWQDLMDAVREVLDAN